MLVSGLSALARTQWDRIVAALVCANGHLAIGWHAHSSAHPSASGW
ncbi:MAG: hypothetical protein ACI83N_001846, partial [Hydrogenophaga sp.]